MTRVTRARERRELLVAALRDASGSADDVERELDALVADVQAIAMLAAPAVRYLSESERHSTITPATRRLHETVQEIYCALDATVDQMREIGAEAVAQSLAPQVERQRALARRLEQLRDDLEAAGHGIDVAYGPSAPSISDRSAR